MRNLNPVVAADGDEYTACDNIDSSLVEMVAEIGSFHLDQPCRFNQIPDEIFVQIFQNLDLKDRCKATAVCRLWRSLLTDGTSYLDEVVVINIFEDTVWDEHVNQSAGSRINCVKLSGSCELRAILSHCTVASSVKIWFSTPGFAISALNVLQDRVIRLKCLDLYPYGSEIPLNAVIDAFPELPGMTMRPHGTAYFWKGLDLAQFPAFEKLDTLLLDSVNLTSTVCLPVSLTTFEWANRGTKRFADLRDRVVHLPNLEYFLIGHADFDDPEEFAALIDTLRQLHRLQYLVFRFCKLGIKDSPAIVESPPALNSLRVLKLDLCYGSIQAIITRFLSLTSSNLRIVSLNQIKEDLSLTDLYESLRPLERRSISLHFGLLEKSQLSKCNETVRGTYAQPPDCWRTVLGKLEASFITDTGLLETLLVNAVYPQLCEIKFVQCSAVTSDLVERIAKIAFRLRKISLINCDGATDSGMLHFVHNFHERLSTDLQIIWKRTRDHPATMFLTLVNDYRHLITELGARFTTKHFPNNAEGEKIFIWDKKRKKTLLIQDYSDSDRHRILGFALSFC